MKTGIVIRTILFIAVLPVIVSDAVLSRALFQAPVTFEVSRAGTLNVQLSHGNIAVETWDRDQVHVAAEGIPDRDMEGVSATIDDNTVTIRFRSMYRRSGKVEFRIHMPENFNVDLHTAGGSITVTGAHQGAARIKTAGGSIQLDRTEGEINVVTAGGNISVSSLAGEGVLQTAGGNISIKSIAGDFDIRTMGGNISLIRGEQVALLRTSGGNINVQEFSGDLNASTAGGNILVQSIVGTGILRTAGGNIRVEKGNGAVEASTSAGDIYMIEQTGSVNASTRMGSVEVRLIPGEYGESGISAMMGNVRLTVPGNIPATIDVTAQGKWGRRTAGDPLVRSDFSPDSFREDIDVVRARYVIDGGGHLINITARQTDAVEIKKSD